jgi:hypothetical protein
VPEPDFHHMFVQHWNGGTGMPADRRRVLGRWTRKDFVDALAKLKCSVSDGTVDRWLLGTNQTNRRDTVTAILAVFFPTPLDSGPEHPDRQRMMDAWERTQRSGGSGPPKPSLTPNTAGAPPAAQIGTEDTPTSRVNTADLTQAADMMRAPALYARPPYLGSHDFVGRADQLAELSEWAQPGDRRPVLIFEAIGGTGKSILAWKWLSQDAPGARNDWAGRFWYSFYERGAQTRDFLLRALSYMAGQNVPHWEQMTVSELTDLLLEKLHQRPWLLVLDGIERLLVDYNRFDAEYRPDEIAGTEDRLSERQPLAMVRDEDADLFRQLLSAGPSKILITSRLLPRCMVNAAHRPLPGLVHQRLPGLRPEDAEALMRICGVFGESQAIQDYLKDNCDCHPLVIGVLAGLVNRFLPDRGNFDRWRIAGEGGLAVDMSRLDLIGRRNHILTHAIAALPEERRNFLGQLAMILNEFDYKVLMALGRTDQHNSDSELAAAVTDLEEHGFLLFDRQSGLYDVHPVVRSVVIGNLHPRAKEKAGERVIDYFSSAAVAPLAEAQTLDDLLPAIHLVQTNLTMNRLEHAWWAFYPALFDALWLNVERHDRSLALLRPFFADGWRGLHPGLPKKILSEIFNCADVSLASIGFLNEALGCGMAHLVLQKELGQSIGCAIHNIGASLCDLGRIGLAQAVIESAVRLAEVECSDVDLFTSHLRLMHIAGLRGDREAADRHWSILDPLGRDWEISRYRHGRAEYLRLLCSYHFGALDLDAVKAAEDIAARYRTSRRVLRDLTRLRGEWHLEQKEYSLAIAALEKAVAMARQSGMRDAQAEAALALARQMAGTLLDGLSVAEHLAAETECAELELALLWEALGQTERALHHAVKECAKASVDGESWIIRHRFDAANRIIERAGRPAYKSVRQDPLRSWPFPLPAYATPGALLKDIQQRTDRLREENADRIQRYAAMSIEDRRVAGKGNQIHKLKAKDSTGRWAYYFVLVANDVEGEFMKVISGVATIDLEEYGRVIASCYGEEPTQEIKDFLYEKYLLRV